MKIEPVAPARRAHRRARRQVDLAPRGPARRARRRRDAASPASAARRTPRRPIARVRALGVDVYEHDVDTLRVLGVGLRGLRRAGGPIDCGNAGTLVRLLAGILAGQTGKRFELAGDASLAPARWSRIAEPLAGWAPRRDDRRARCRSASRAGRCRPITYELPVASAQVKSASCSPASTQAGETTVVEPVPTRDHTEPLLRGAGARVTRRPTQRDGMAGRAARARRRRGARRLLLGGAVRRRRDARPGLRAARPRRQPQPAAHRPARRARADGRRASPSTTAGASAGEPAGDLDVRHAELVGTNVGAEEVPLRDRRAAALRARGRLRARRERRYAAPASCGRRRPTGSRPSSTGCAGSARTSGRRRTASESAASRPGCAAARWTSRGDHRIAMLAAVAGLASREGVRSRGRRGVAVSFPGFFDLLRSSKKPDNAALMRVRPHPASPRSPERRT